jgi:S-DNA-T family DNA segregation ATPase FtsK/SpoIIIE
VTSVPSMKRILHRCPALYHGRQEEFFNGLLGVKARAAGIHLVFAAQRPDANVMPMQLRANLGNRLILKVDAAGTSEIALGEPGAEFLLGHGHLLAKLEGAPGLCFAQVPLAEPTFIDAIVGVMAKV